MTKVRIDVDKNMLWKWFRIDCQKLSLLLKRLSDTKIKALKWFLPFPPNFVRFGNLMIVEIVHENDHDIGDSIHDYKTVRSDSTFSSAATQRPWYTPPPDSGMPR